MKVSRITTTRFQGRDCIRLYGYNEEGQPIKQIKDFKNYFFVEEHNMEKIKNSIEIDEKQFKTYDSNLHDKDIYKVSLNSKSFKIPSYIKKLAYQSDIKVETKYMNDNNLEYSRKRHIAYFDIETYFDKDNPKSNNVDKAQAPITSITFYSNFLEQYFVLVWHPSIVVENKEDLFNIEVKNDNENYYYFDNEVDMIQTFCLMIKDFNVDILTGWWSHGYDVPYIVNRLENLGLSKDILSPENNSWIGTPRKTFNATYTIRIKGLDTIDMMEVVQTMNYNLQNNKLDTAAKEILGDEYGKVTEVTWRDWEDNLEGFLKYAVRDVEILAKIDEKLKLFEYLIQMQLLSGVIQLNDIQSVTQLIDSLILKRYWDKYVFPNNERKSRVNYKGGLTIDPTEPGVHKEVMVFDYASLYPTTIMAYNISPETYLFSLNEIGREEFDKRLKELDEAGIKYVDTGESEELFGGRYILLAHTEKIGIYPELVDELYNKRKEYKKLMKKTTGDEKMLADKRQYAIKIILNSMYGAFGFNFFRLYVPECADTITYLARKANLYAMETMGTCGKVLYGDTDSVGENSLIRYRIKSK